ncbi:hypothetical protein PAAG_01886 [Paracoccidioides lutzii Pb01]|uniref:Ribonuclease H2 subunit B n=1 Tax=Paracoccidioides lutzii (strain ATCC MYA-826 / Pb01) TaxID=502779 RepID=C1GTP1_PARBA|nr:hypothetical protein PAAG_01886 [Paracoccidioides lutzii Pb01]EEH39697.1 hypothetical protein PAAG_01886 [Paracoccidioides lutzii Pb01]
MRTRSAPARNVSNDEVDQSTPASVPSKSTKTLILPSNASDDARFISLENPRTGTQSRYFFCPKLGLYEFTAISSSSSTPRSTLFTGTTTTTTKANASPVADKREGEAQNGCYRMVSSGSSAEANEVIHQVVLDWAPTKATVAKHAQLLVTTPVDLLFFLLPILAAASGYSTAQKLFQPLDDMLDFQDNVSKPLRRILLGSLRSKAVARMAAVCDTVEAGETMYRLNEEKLVRELVSKAERMAANGLPPSLEEHFIHRALELPILSVKRDDILTSTSDVSDVASGANNSFEKVESQTTDSTTPITTSFATSFTSSDVSTPNTVITPPTNESLSPNCDIHQLLRIHTAISFLQSSYLPKHLSSRVKNILSSSEKSPKDFSPLTQHLKHIAELREKVLASRSPSDFSRKRGVEDDEGAEIRAEKKRKKEEEEKKKKLGESRGVRDLKKVNVKGMKKLSAFFGKKM